MRYRRWRWVWIAVALCALAAFPTAHAETRPRPASYYEALEKLGLTEAETPAPSPSPTKRIRSDDYYEAMERLDEFSEMTQSLFDEGRIVYLQPSVPQANANGPMVALTFDDGPGSLTPRILELLDQYGGHATFFMVGNRVANHRDIVQQVYDQGSEIGTHTWSHPDLTKLSRDDIRGQLVSSMDAITAITGAPVTLMRPPYGSNNEATRGICADLGLPLIRWSIDTEDWRTRNANATYNAIFDNLQPNSIILCHDIHAATIEAMEYVIPELARRGYRMVTISELFAQTGAAAVPGRVYHKIGE